MVVPAELAQIEEDFLSGRNPLAYIPLCHALRRQRQFPRALELCQRGLAGDPSSIAGRTLYARLLSDLGHYEDALREVARAETQAPGAMGLLIEKTRCLLRLHRLEEANEVLQPLLDHSPLDPEVQLLSTQVRQLRARAAAASISGSDSSQRVLRLTNREMLQQLLELLRPHALVLSCAVIPVKAGEPAVEGNPALAEAAYAFYSGVDRVSRDLDEPPMRMGILETESAQIIVLVRKDALVSIGFEPTPRFGKLYHRFHTAVCQLLPEAAPDFSPSDKEM